MESTINIVLAGNPNCGKTAVFNALTKSRQRVGTWPGVTVEKKTGHFQHQGHRVAVVDLPGVYSTSVMLNAGAVDEGIACQYLLSNETDFIVNVIDASNLERNLYLTLQLLEMNIPMILAVNMMDVVEQRGLTLDLKQLSKLLGCPVVGLVAKQGRGIEVLKNAIVKSHHHRRSPQFTLPLPEEIHRSVNLITQLIQVDHADQNAGWLALRLLEGDQFAARQMAASVLKVSQQEERRIEKKLGEGTDILVADARYAFASQISQKITQLVKTSRQTITQWIDRVVLNRYLGLPIFLGVMYLMFLFSINVGGAFQDFFDMGSSTIFVSGAAHLLTQWHCPVWLTAIVSNGIGKGINTMITFIPVIGGMFLFLAFLEDSGYMARIAFVMDRFMCALGLPGKSFVPMIVGFGCNVPAVMGARTLENRRDRILSVLMMPFMSCGARLAIFAVFASAFFPQHGATIIFLLYLTGILVAILSGFVLRKTMLSGKPAPLVMELPPYHMPRMRSVGRQTWYRLKSFLTRAGKVIIPVCVLIGVLNSVTVTGQLVQGGGQHTLLSAAGRVATPVFAPMGVHQDNWPATVGLITGVLAKEVVVGALNTLYSGMGHSIQQTTHQFSLRDGLRQAVASIPQNLKGLLVAFKNPIAASESPHNMNKAAYGVMYQRFSGKAGAFAYLLFVLLYFPCISTLAVMRREVGRGWAYFSVLWSTGLAYVLSVMCYQLLTIATHPISSIIWLLSMLVALVMAVVGLRHYAQPRTKLMGSNPMLQGE